MLQYAMINSTYIYIYRPHVFFYTMILTKWPTSCRRYFRMHFLKECLILASQFCRRLFPAWLIIHGSTACGMARNKFLCSYVCYFLPQHGLVHSRDFARELPSQLPPVGTHHIYEDLYLKFWEGLLLCHFLQKYKGAKNWDDWQCDVSKCVLRLLYKIPDMV